MTDTAPSLREARAGATAFVPVAAPAFASRPSASRRSGGRVRDGDQIRLGAGATRSPPSHSARSIHSAMARPISWGWSS